MSKKEIDIENYSVEDFVQLIIEKKETVISLNKKINSGKINQKNRQNLSKKMQIVESRLKENLPFNKIILCVLFPSRTILGLFKVFNPYDELKKGFKRKVNQFYAFSVLGNVLYLVVLILVFLSKK